MASLEYQHIGHDPRHGELALWSLDESGELLTDRRRFARTGRDWMDWSHDKVFAEVKIRAAGRVELDRKAGSINLQDPALATDDRRIVRLVQKLDRRFPEVRWYLFGAGFKGESAVSVLAQRLAA